MSITIFSQKNLTLHSPFEKFNEIRLTQLVTLASSLPIIWLIQCNISHDIPENRNRLLKRCFFCIMIDTKFVMIHIFLLSTILKYPSVQVFHVWINIRLLMEGCGLFIDLLIMRRWIHGIMTNSGVSRRLSMKILSKIDNRF